MRRVELLVFLCCLLSSLAGCTRSSDVEIRNPLTSGSVEPNAITKRHKPTEDRFGLPLHALDDEATLVSVDAKTICIALTLRETDPISLREMTAELKARSEKTKSKTVAPAELRDEPVSVSTHAGRVPVQQRTGSTSSCTDRDDAGNCRTWDTSPTYAQSYVPGVVEVYEAKGNVCFPNDGLVSEKTRQLTLDVALRRRAPPNAGPSVLAGWGGGTSTKEVTFRWGFSESKGTAAPTAPTAVAEQPAEKNKPAAGAPPARAKVPARAPQQHAPRAHAKVPTSVPASQAPRWRSEGLERP